MSQPAATELSHETENNKESASLSKKAAKKEAAKLEKLRRRQEQVAAALAQSAEPEDPLATNYGDVPLHLESMNMVALTSVGALTEALKDKKVVIRGNVQTIRTKGKKMAFVVVEKEGFTVQCVVTVQQEIVSPQMVKYVSKLTRESIIYIEGIVSKPDGAITGASQQVDVHVRKLYCLSRAAVLPIVPEDAARRENPNDNAAHVEQDTHLNFRVLDLRTPANKGIFRIQSQVSTVFRQFLLSEGFIEIHTPKLNAGSSEGGASEFKLDYMGQPACLAQSPQLHKQMAICAKFGRVFEIGPVFRAEK
ncbi:hypothetical protein ACLB2K_011210 [Fragaria x ananassa]